MQHHDDIVFIYGALRSGTTVFRLMLNAHPQMANPGEMDFLFDHLHRDAAHPTGWRYDTAALELNWMFRASDLAIDPALNGLDLLASFFDQLKARHPGRVLSINLHRHVDRAFAVLPKVRVLHMLRDPRDVARSSIQMGWAGTLYHGVGHWMETETAWDVGKAGTDPAQILEITYEGLFRDIDQTLHQVCAFFEVPFDPAMLRYHEDTTYGPPDVSLTEQWRRKCTPQELEEIESRAGPLMEQRGYERSQPATELPGARKRSLSLRNKLYVWRFGMNRYGAATYWLEKLTRWIGLTALNQKITLRMQNIVVQHLK